MKNLILSAAIIAASFSPAFAAAHYNPTVNHFIFTDANDWMKSTSGTWTGMSDGKKVWYKLNSKDATLWWSADAGKTWTAVPNGMWQDKDGKWLKINSGKLVWSADGGKTWVDVPDGTWQDTEGNWFKFDKDWMLWEKKGDMQMK